jgi:hypothetical protein
VAAGARADATSDPPVTFVATPTEVTGFVGAVQSLFRDMDGTLQFPKRFERLNASSA